MCYYILNYILYEVFETIWTRVRTCQNGLAAPMKLGHSKIKQRKQNNKTERENQIFRQSCIEPYPGHQRIFFASSGMLPCRLEADRFLSERRSH